MSPLPLPSEPEQWLPEYPTTEEEEEDEVPSISSDGVDLNRNFPGGWGQGHSSFIKESTEPSTSVYKGYKRKS